MNFNNSRLVDHKPMKFGTFVPYIYRFVIIVIYLTNFFKLEWNLGIKFTLRFFFLSVYNNEAFLRLLWDTEYFPILLRDTRVFVVFYFGIWNIIYFIYLFFGGWGGSGGYYFLDWQYLCSVYYIWNIFDSGLFCKCIVYFDTSSFSYRCLLLQVGAFH